MALLLSRILINLYDAIVGVIFVYKFTRGEKLKPRELFICLAVVLGMLLVAPWYINNHQNLYMYVYPINGTVIQAIALLFVSFGCGKAGVVQKIVAPIIFESLLYFFNSNWWFTVLSNTLKYPPVLLSLSLLTSLLIVFMIKLLMTSVLLFIVKAVTYKGRYRFITTVTYILSPIFTMLTLYIFMKILFYRVNEYSVETIIACVGTAGVNILSFTLFNRTVAAEEENGKLQLALCKAELEHERYTELLNINTEINALKHDLKHQLLCVDNCLETGDMTERNRHMQTLNKIIDNIGTPVLTGNSLIDYIISSKIGNGSDVKVVTVGTLDAIGVDDIDLSVLIGNILDNALEAVSQVESEEKLIEFSFSEFQGYKNIVVKNSISNPVLDTNGDLKTTKDDKSRHGFGVRSIKNIVEKYDGFVRFYEEESRFCVHAAFPA